MDPRICQHRGIKSSAPMSAEYKSEKVILAAPIEQVYARYANMENLKALIEKAPADRISPEQMEQLKNIEVTPDSITVQGGPTGSIKLNVVNRVEPCLIALRPEGIPIDMEMQLRFESLDASSTAAEAAIEADIPMMLRPMVKGPLQKVVDQFAAMMAAIPY